jgi:deoxycytidylate deaminase
MGNCSDVPCASGCDGIHAEVNALLRANGKARIAYVTHAPCWHCMKTIANSGVNRVVFLDADTLEDRTARLAQESGIDLEHFIA